MERARVAVVVSDDATRVEQWAWWLERAGSRVLSCPGPFIARCPRVDGRPCPLRESAEVAVIDLADEGGELLGGYVERYCTKLPDAGDTVRVARDRADAARAS